MEPELENEKSHPEFVCSYCKTTTTPMWRKGPHGKNTLCNRCGIKWSRVQNPRKKSKRTNGNRHSESRNVIEDRVHQTSPDLTPVEPSENADPNERHNDTEDLLKQESLLMEKMIASRNYFNNQLSKKSSSSSDEDSPPPSVRTSPRPRTTKRKVTPPPPPLLHSVETRLPRRGAGKKNQSSDSQQEDRDVPSAEDLLQKIRESKILVDVTVPERPLDERQLRFFNQAAVELKKAEQSMLRWL